jgi:hypothetical protein
MPELVFEVVQEADAMGANGMLTQCVTVLLAAATVLAQVPPKAEDSPQPYAVPEAYEVYSILLPQDWMWRYAHADTLVLRTETESYKMCLDPDTASKQILGPAISDYNRVNQKRWLLQRQFQIEKPYELAPASQLSTLLRTGAAPGWIEVSAVGFNDVKTVAVVYIGHHCGSLCGGGEFHVLQKKDGKWQPLKWNGMSCAWAS